jgi:hypothetical protein
MVSDGAPAASDRGCRPGSGCSCGQIDGRHLGTLSVLEGWALKATILHYGGMRLYCAARPFFLGLILGDYIVPTFWAIWGTVIDTQMYMTFPH